MKKAPLVALVAAAAIAAGVVSPAKADYGPGTVYQVEISANSLDRGNFWFWAALGPGEESDYQNTDCIHASAGGNPGGPDGASHTSGTLAAWSDTSGMIEMDGVSIVGGAATANFYVSDQPHSHWFELIVTKEYVPIPLPVDVPIVYSGAQTQVEVAP